MCRGAPYNLDSGDMGPLSRTPFTRSDGRPHSAYRGMDACFYTSREVYVVLNVYTQAFSILFLFLDILPQIKNLFITLKICSCLVEETITDLARKIRLLHMT